jgi:hypothetical protein
MSGEKDEPTRDEVLRRTFLAGLAGVSGFAATGCVGGNGGDTEDEDAEQPQRTEGLGPAPEEYENSTAVGGMEREDTDDLLSYDAAGYQSSPKNDRQCDGCRYWIPDKNDDGLGACAIVANEIEPDGWCGRYAPQT